MLATCLLLLCSGLLFALQFCINKFYQARKPRGESRSVLYAIEGKAIAALFFAACLFASGGAFFGNGYTLLAGVGQAALNLLITVLGMRVLAVGSVGMYTLSMMIGGMAVPVAFGAAVLGDPFPWVRVLAFFLIAAAVVLCVSGEGKKSKLAYALYAILFFSNGGIGVLTAMHSNVWGAGISELTFMFVTSVTAAIAPLPLWLCFAVKERKSFPHEKEGMAPLPRLQKIFYVCSPALAGLANGVANYLIVIGTAAEGIGSVGTFPLVTGGTVLFTVLASWLFYREKPSLRGGIGAGLIVLSLGLFMF